MEDKQKLTDEILTTINKCSNEQDSLEKISSRGKNEYKKQKIEIENQFEMIINMLKATQTQLLTQLEQKHKKQQTELNYKISKYYNFTKKYREENQSINQDNITQLADIHDRVNRGYVSLLKSQKYVHKNINVVLDTSIIMNHIQKIAYIQERTKEEMSQRTQFTFHDNNKNIYVRPQIIALNTNSLNTKICVSWKLNPVHSLFAKNSLHASSPPSINFEDTTPESKENTKSKESLEKSKARMRRNSLSLTDDPSVDTTNVSMNIHDIVSIDIEWRYTTETDETNEQKRWNILDVDHHKILAFDLNSSIFDHILNTTRYGIYHFRICLYNRNSKTKSKEMVITTWKVQIRHIADEWNLEKKQKALRLGFFNRKIVTRDIPGKFRHIFGSLIVSKGVNVWTLKMKKIDPNRQQCSSMIGVINMSQRTEQYNEKLKTLNQCFAHIGVGYGLFAVNGDVYHIKKPRIFGKPLKEGDIVQIMCDYRGNTISFIVNNINWGIAFDRTHFPMGKMPHLGLAVALRGCDEIQLIDFTNEAQSIFKKRRSSSVSMKKLRQKSTDKYGKLGSPGGKNKKGDVNDVRNNENALQ